MSHADHICRLKAIVSVLHHWKYEEPLTKSKIVEWLSNIAVLDACGKTIGRDLKALIKGYDAPLRYTSEKGWYLTDPAWACEFDLDDVSAQEVYALALATELTAQFKGTPLHKELKELTRSLQARYEEEHELPENLTKKVQFLSPPAAPVDPPVWDAIMTGLLENRMMKIKYQPYGRPETEMTLAPCRLVSLENEWYLFSEKQSTLRTQIRQLAVRNISHPIVLETTFNDSPVREKEIQDMLDHRFGWFACEREIERVTVVFDKTVSYLLDTRTWHKKQTKRTLENGDLEISFPTSGAGNDPFRFFEVRKWILSYGRYVKSVSPAKLKKYVLEDLKAAQDNLAD